jgi:Bacterial mobilisation protein (MobC)
MAKKIFNSGRKKPPEPKRIARVNLRLTEIEKEDWEAKAESIGCGNNLSKFIRLIVEKGHVTAPPTIPAINKSTYFELGKIGTNLNQITTAINYAVKMGVAIESDPRPNIEVVQKMLIRIELRLINMPDTIPDKDLTESLGENNDC